MFQKGCFLIQKQNISQQTTNSQSALVEMKIKETRARGRLGRHSSNNIVSKGIL